MGSKKIPVIMKCVTPMHAGVGQQLGIIDMPIQREKYTNFPKIEASGLKGAFREEFEKITSKDIIFRLFGPENGSENAGAVGFHDARIIAFPVKSVKYVFALVTCPLVINKFFKEVGEDVDVDEPEEGYFYAHSDCKCYIREDRKKIILEEYLFEKKEDTEKNEKVIDKMEEITGKNLKERLIILSDSDFEDFVSFSTEVIQRIKIDSSTGVVSGNALFNEEYLPTESVMYSTIFIDRIFGTKEKRKEFYDEFKKKIEVEIDEKNEQEKIADFIKKVIINIKYILIGGNYSIGKGFTELSFIGTEKAGEIQ